MLPLGKSPDQRQVTLCIGIQPVVSVIILTIGKAGLVDIVHSSKNQCISGIDLPGKLGGKGVFRF